jgi:hypothetical protein
MAVGWNSISVGGGGTLSIYDNGVNGVEFLLGQSFSATNSGGLPWSGSILGVGVGGSFAWPSGGGTRSVATYSVTSSGYITFTLGATGTSGFGDGGSLTIYVDRAPAASPPNTPAAPTFKDITATSATVDWTNPGTNGAGITQTDLHVGIGPAHDPTNSNIWYNWVPVSPSEKNFTTFLPGRTYYAAVRMDSSAGVSNWSSWANFTTPDVGAPKPATPTFISKTTTSVTLSVVDPAGAYSPILERQNQLATDSLFSAVVATNTTATSSRIFSSLVRGTTYYSRYRVRTNAGWSAWSDTLTVATPGTAPSAPTGYTIYDVASTSAVVSLGTLADNGGQVPVKVRVKVSTTNSDSGLIQTVIGDEWLPLPIYELTPGTSYWVSEAAYNSVEGGGWGPYGGWSPFTTKTNVPRAPTSIVVDGIFSSQATVNWGAPSDLLGADLLTYTIRVAKNRQLTTELQTLSTVDGDFDRTVTGLDETETYWVEVSSVSNLGAGSRATPVMFIAAGGIAPVTTALRMMIPGVGVRSGTMWIQVPTDDASYPDFFYPSEALAYPDYSDAIPRETVPWMKIDGEWKVGV